MECYLHEVKIKNTPWTDNAMSYYDPSFGGLIKMRPF